MSWFSGLAGKAESLLNNIDEQTGVVLRSQSSIKDKKNAIYNNSDSAIGPRRLRNQKKSTSKLENKSVTVQTIKNVPQGSRQIQHNRNISPTRRQNSPNKFPRPLVENVKINQAKDSGLRRRRNTLPADSQTNSTDLVFEMQSLEVENAMLKNEIIVMNSETSDLITRLKKTEEELSITQNKLDNSEQLNRLIKITKESLDTQLEELKLQLSQKNAVEIERHKEQSLERELEVNRLTTKNKHIMERITILEEDINSKDLRICKLEKELRHAQTKTEDVESALKKATEDSQHLEKDWEAYKLRVKNMLHAKDNEIKLLREGSNFSEETKMMREQVESLREEKEELSASLSRIKEEQNEARLYLTRLEEMRGAAERLAGALKDALREERAERNKVEARCEALTQKLQALEMDTAQTISDLRLSLQSKVEEINLLRESTSNVATANPSALNVADYDVIQKDKIQCLTQSLTQKQGNIDSLLADNNILRIQLGKLESKLKAELAMKSSHSVVNFQDGDVRRTRTLSADPLSSLSVKIGMMIRRNPIFRTFVMCYVIGLHLWVITVLFTSTPQEYVPKPSRL